jgi:hypothetical protein
LGLGRLYPVGDGWGFLDDDTPISQAVLLDLQAEFHKRVLSLRVNPVKQPVGR